MQSTIAPPAHSVLPEDAAILVVEDTPANLEAMEFLLKEIMEIRLYEGGSSGLWLFQWLLANPAQPIDLILLDMQIPFADGFQVYAQLRRIQDASPMLRHTRIVALTANTATDIVQRCRAEGFDGFIGKPTRPQHFPDQIRRILAGEGVWEPR